MWNLVISPSWIANPAGAKSILFKKIGLETFKLQVILNGLSFASGWQFGR